MFTKKFFIKRYDLIIVDPFPVNYKVGIWRELNSTLKIKFKVIFLYDHVFHDHYDSGFNTIRKYDRSLLDGFTSINYKNLIGFLNIIKESKVVLLHGYNLGQNWIVLFFSKIFKTKIIWRGESSLRGIENKINLKQKIKKYLLTFFFKNCDAVLYSCSGNKEFLKFYGVNKNKLFYVQCAVDNQFLKDQKNKILKGHNVLPETIGVNRGHLIILFVARFTKRKRQLDLLHALKRLNNSNITTIFIGDGPEKKNMQDFASKNKINAKFMGFLDQVEIIKYYILADVKVVLSDYDPSPKALNEAMNFSLPVIVTDIIGTAKDLVKNGENGFIVEVGNISSISNKIKFFAENRNVIKKMGDQSFKIVDKWNFKENAKNIIKSISYVLQE